MDGHFRFNLDTVDLLPQPAHATSDEIALFQHPHDRTASMISSAAATRQTAAPTASSTLGTTSGTPSAGAERQQLLSALVRRNP
ncbi:hypothetical protein [Streptomyces sp. NPDC059165]|uniref:hypothetical protein n=1 Tax=Streptomyces sp. NPDC059165 TaxID=3346751 RepID=UPI003696C5C3